MDETETIPAGELRIGDATDTPHGPWVVLRADADGTILEIETIDPYKRNTVGHIERDIPVQIRKRKDS